MHFTKYHALGNDYLVLPPTADEQPVNPAQIRRICDRHRGVGSDGILFGPLKSTQADFRLRIFNPDASEAEKSGNGLRIFCRYLWDEKLVQDLPFSIETLGGIVTAQVFEDGRRVRVAMGQVSFSSAKIPLAGPTRDVLMEDIEVNGRHFQFCAATVGNPHCIIPVDEVSSEMAREYGPLLETHPLFPNRSNVQFMQVLGRDKIRIEIWERGAGYTLASGSSSCAAASVAYRLGLCEPHITVQMPGGEIDIAIDDHFMVAMTGPVVRVLHGKLFDEGLAGA